MVRILVTGLWICLITILSSYAAVTWMANVTQAKPDEFLDVMTYHKVSPLQIPIIADGGVQGYVVVTMVYTTDSRTTTHVSVTPTVFVTDEAFQEFYNDPNLDFRNLTKYDITGRLATIKAAVNKRIGSDIISDLMIENLNFVTKKDIRP